MAAALTLAACAKPAGGGLPADALDRAIGAAIGDPTTCVLIADAASRRVLYRYGELFNCERGLPACDRPGFLTAKQALALADATAGRGASCPSNADGSRQVGWAEGRYAGKGGTRLYSAAMEGERALPGEEMNARLGDAFSKAGL